MLPRPGTIHNRCAPDAGYNLTTGNDNIDLGNNSIAGESGNIRLGTAGT
jgi:hypothetical protein